MRLNSCSTAAPGLAYAATKLIVKLELTFQSQYPSSSKAMLFEVRVPAWSRLKT